MVGVGALVVEVAVAPAVVDAAVEHGKLQLVGMEFGSAPEIGIVIVLKAIEVCAVRRYVVEELDGPVDVGLDASAGEWGCDT